MVDNFKCPMDRCCQALLFKFETLVTIIFNELKCNSCFKRHCRHTFIQNLETLSKKTAFSLCSHTTDSEICVLLIDQACTSVTPDGVR